MKKFDQQTYLRMSNEQRDYYIGHEIDTHNVYYFFEKGDEASFKELSDSVREHGRAKTNFDKYLGGTPEPGLKTDEDRQQELFDLIPGNNLGPSKEVLEILENISQPKGKLVLKDCRVLFLELFKNYIN